MSGNRARRVQSVSSGGSSGGGDSSKDSSGGSSTPGCSEWRDWKACVSCLFPPPSASSLLFLFSQLPGRSAEQVVGARIRSLEALQDRIVDCPGPELRRVGARADCRSPLGGVSRGPAPRATPANREQTQKPRARVGRAGSATSLWRSPRDKASQLTLPTQPRRGSESQTALFVPQDSHSVDSLLGDFSR